LVGGTGSRPGWVELGWRSPTSPDITMYVPGAVPSISNTLILVLLETLWAFLHRRKQIPKIKYLA
jgi:hypothetical protein